MLGNTKARLLYTGLLASAVAFAPLAARAADTATLTGHVSSMTAIGAKLGAAPDEQKVLIAVHMAAKDAAGLKSLADSVSKPSSEHYGDYLTKEEFAARFAPDAADVTAVREMLAKGGMKDLVVGPHGMYVTAQATVAQIRSTFAVSQDLYSYRGKTMRANKEEPTVPAALAGKIVFIEGLDDTPFLKQPFHHSAVAGELKAPAAAVAAPAAASAVTPPPVAAGNPSSHCANFFGDLVGTLSTKPGPYAKKIPWLVCGYTPNQIKEAYGFFNTPYDGTGVTVGIIDAFASPTLMADGNRYAADQGLPPLTSDNFKEMIPEGIYNVPAAQVTNAYGWWGEESLDLAAVHGSAPGANILYIGSTDNGTSLDVALMNAVYNHVADILTNSYGNNGEAIGAAQQTADDQAFMAGVAMGITLLFSSGDDGDLSAPNGVATGSWEATSAYVTGVGGTSLALTKENGTKSEYGWGTYRDFLEGVTISPDGTAVTTSGLLTTTAFGVTFDAFSYYAGSGGGISLIEPQPAYQAGVVPAALATTLNEASGYAITLPQPQRVSPDVAMVADPYTGYLYGESFTIAGSASADFGCTALTATTEYCETAIGGTSLASPLMAGVMAVMDQKRLSKGEPLVGFANPLFYSYKSGTTLKAAGLNQISAPTSPVAMLRGYLNNPTELRLITINSVPLLYTTAPYALEVCGLPICEGLNEVFNYTSNAADFASGTTTPAGYNDVTGLGVPWVPKLIQY